MDVVSDPTELCCPAEIEGVRCNKTFANFSDFEEHFLEIHLELMLYACGGDGCTAQFPTALQMFRHLAVCKRNGKKVKVLKGPEDVLDRLVYLDQAKLRTTHLCIARTVKRLQRANNFSAERGEESDTESSCGGSATVPVNDDEELHTPITEEQICPDRYETQEEPGPSRRERAVTPARQAAWRMKEQLLEERKKQKIAKNLLKKADDDTHVKKKRLPIKITHNSRFSKLINTEDSRTSNASSSRSQIDETGPSGNTVSDHDHDPQNSMTEPAGITEILGNVFKKQSVDDVQANASITGVRNTTISTGNKPTLMSSAHELGRERPRVFESSLPAGPNLVPPRTVVPSRRRSASLGPEHSRPPDYSDFLRNPAINPALRRVPARAPPPTASSSQMSLALPSRISSTGSEFDRQGGAEVETAPKVTAKATPTVTKGILKNKTPKTEGAVTGQMDLSIVSLFSNKANQPSVSTPSEDLKNNVEANTTSLRTDQMDDRDDEEVPNLLNLFSGDGTESPKLFDPRIGPSNSSSQVKEEDEVLVLSVVTKRDNTSQQQQSEKEMVGFRKRKKSAARDSTEHFHTTRPKTKESGSSGRSSGFGDRMQDHRNSPYRHRHAKSRRSRSPRRSRSRSRSWSDAGNRSTHHSWSGRSSWGARNSRSRSRS